MATHASWNCPDGLGVTGVFGHNCLRREENGDFPKGDEMLFALFYVVAILILILHFTGFLARRNLEWLVLVLAVAVFPAVIYL
jgi:hypothetical protein